MEIGIPREVKVLEGRVALTPMAVKELITANHHVFIEILFTCFSRPPALRRSHSRAFFCAPSRGPGRGPLLTQRLPLAPISGPLELCMSVPISGLHMYAEPLGLHMYAEPLGLHMYAKPLGRPSRRRMPGRAAAAGSWRSAGSA